MKKQVEKAKEFRRLHQAGTFVLGNVWNPGIARIFESKGFKALATTSAGVAYSFGLQDGENLPLDDLLMISAKIIEKTDLPVSIDLERGYGGSPSAIRENVKKALDIGAVGINIEDGVISPLKSLIGEEQQVMVINRISGLKQETGIPFVINARTDAYWLNMGEQSEKMANTIQRANMYLEAGADCIFVPGLLEIEEMKVLVKEIKGPLNVLAMPGSPSVSDLQQIGVRRISLGSRPANCVLKLLSDIADEIETKGTFRKLDENTINYQEANKLF